MDELTKGLTFSLNADDAAQALARCAGQLAAWGFVMPAVEPLVFDFGLGDFHRDGLIEYWVANEIKGGYCGKFLFVFDGQTCPMHRHMKKAETFFLLKGKLRVQYEDREIVLSEGGVLHVEPMTYHSFQGLGPALLLELSSPCFIDDNDFVNPEIPFGLNHAKPQASLPSRNH